MSSLRDFDPVQTLIQCLDGPGKQFPRLATPADRQSIRATAAQFNDMCREEARTALKGGKIFQWAGIKALGWLAYGSAHFVAKRPVLAIDLRGQGDDLKVKLEIGDRGRVLVSDQPRSRHRSLQ